jgi:predicted nucleic acid-binding protein
VVLVDTNVVAHLIGGDHIEGAQELRRLDSDWRSEAFLLVEFTNVLASWIANRRMSSTLAKEVLAQAITLLDNKLVRVAHTSILSTAVTHRVSACDARFIALAQQIGHPLITEDAKLRAAAPKLIQSIAQALAVA